ncbi:MAG: hypothetical protein R3E86_10535 [Pseudomonadales bacterium]
MELSFQEKSIFGTLLGLLLVAIYFFVNVAEIAGSPVATDAGALMGLCIVVVLASIVFQVAYHVIIAILDRRDMPDGKPPFDERDARIDSRASKLAYLVLSIGAVVALGHLVVGDAVVPERAASFAQSNSMTAVILMATLLLAEMVKCVTQLWYYRHGI